MGSFLILLGKITFSQKKDVFRTCRFIYVQIFLLQRVTKLLMYFVVVVFCFLIF